MPLSREFCRVIEDRYSLERQIGEGGMATVYLARDHRHQRHVAIKILKPDVGSAITAERFLEEIRVTANLHHPHLLPLFDSGEADGLLYYVMPYVAGESLRVKLRREGALPLQEALRIAKVLAEAIDYAHRQGVVHRDLKPENILLADSQPLIADFGIALAVSDAATTRITTPGLLVGTPQYMSPEQAAGDRTIDGRTDIYALGAILYEMLTGQPPHTGPTGPAVLAKVLTQAPPGVSTLRASVSPELDAVVERALARVPADRWQTAAAFAGALDRASGVTAVTPSSREARPPSPPRPLRAPRGPVAAVIVVAVLAVMVLFAWLSTTGLKVAPGNAARSAGAPRFVAVIPFENRSADKNDAYFSDGLTEELLHRLAQVKTLHVAARTSSFAFKGRETTIEDVARRLNVEAIVSGSVRRAGDRLRVTVQLIDVSDGRPIWSQSYERDARDAFSVQDEIAQQIVQRLDPAASSPNAASSVPSAEAFDAYLQGRFEWNRRTAEGVMASIRLLTRATQLAPEYARAYAGLAEAYAVMRFYDSMAPREAFTLARSAANRAALLDPALPEAPNTLGYVALYHDWNLPAAEREFKQAIALNGRYAVAHQWYANMLTAAGRFAEAAASMSRAQELDPLAPIPYAALGWVYLHSRDFIQAEKQLRHTLQVHSGYFLAQLWLGEALEGQGRFAEALVTVEEALRTAPENVTARLVRARLLARLKRVDEAHALLTAVQRLAVSQYVPAYPQALVLAALGDLDGAFVLLDRAVADRAHAIALLRVDPQLDVLRSDPRFPALAERAGAR